MRLKQLASYENGLVLMLGITFGLVGFDRGAISVLMPFIVDDLVLTNTQVGLLGAALSLTWAPANLVAGRMSDLLGMRKPLLVGAVIVFSLCTAASGLAASFALLLSARLLMGLAQGPAAPLVMIMMAESSSPARRGLNGGLVGMFGVLLATAAPVVLVVLAESSSWRTAFYVAGAPGILVALMIVAFVRERPAPDRAAAARTSVKEVIRVRNVWLSALCCCCLAGYAAAFFSFAPLYLVQVREMAPTQMGVLLSIVGLGSLVTGGIVLALSDRVGHKTVVVAANFAAVLAPLAVLSSVESFAALALLMILGATATSTLPLFIMAIPAGSVPAHSFGTALGFVAASAEIVGGAFVPTIAGWAADQTSLAAPLYVSVGCALACGTIALLLTETAAGKLAHTAARVATQRAAG